MNHQVSGSPQHVFVHQPHAATNGLGVAGFVLSLLGLLFTCGLLSPLGLIFSLIGMFREPKGLAIAGFILGLIGSLWIVVLVFFIGVGTFLAILGGLAA